MPYGLPKSKGGESKTNISKMESCVTSVMAKNKGRKGFTKSNAIAICKTSLGFTNKGKSHHSPWSSQYRGPGYTATM